MMKMSISSFLLVLFLLASSSVSGFNITSILSEYPDFGAFNGLLSQTHLAEAANKRSTITVLALNNNSVSSISGRDSDEISNILMNHILLDYYDNNKIRGVTRRSTIITTLYQTTGVAEDQQGHLNMTKLAPGVVVFGSAVNGTPLVAKLIGQVYTRPFNLSVLHVTTPIVAPGQGKAVLPPPPPPNSPPPPSPPEEPQAPAPAPSPTDDYSSPEVSPTLAPVPAPAPAPSPYSPADAPAPKKMDDADADADKDDASSASSTFRLHLHPLLLPLFAAWLAL